MATALMISRNDIVSLTALNGNIDDDKYLLYVKIAQDVHLKNILGTDLFNKISSDIVAGTLSGNYLTLTNTYIKPMLVYWFMVEYLPFASYNITAKGVLKGTSETAETVSKEDIDFLVAKNRGLAQAYTDDFIRYMQYNYGTYPEYSSNTNDDRLPSTNNSTFGGWVM